MNKFPFEILENIFTRLHFINKLECIHVCRQWANVIREESLLHTVSIIEGENIEVNYLFSLLEREPWRRKQVKKLLFGHSTWKSIGRFFRADLLINLKFLYLSRLNGVYTHYIQHLPREATMSFMNHIEHVEDCTGSGFVDELLTRGTYPRLTTLVLWLIPYDEADDIHTAMIINGESENSINERNQDVGKRIVSHSFNAPALRKLDFTNFDFHINDFEVTHASLLQLQSLTITNGTLRGDRPPYNVISTDSLKKLSLVGISINSLSLYNMIRYMMEKYTCLQELIIAPRSDSFVQETDANAFMKKFSKQLSTLEFPIRTGFVEWELTILGHSEFDPAPLKELSHLDKLHISCLGMAPHSKIDIVSVLRSCPDNLTSLILYDVILKDELPMDHTLALQELKIYSRSSSLKQFDLFLSKCCPQLRSLTLDSCFSAGNDLNLSDLSLLYIKIVLSYPRVKEQPVQDFPSHPKTLFLVVTPKTEQLYYVDGCNDIGTREVFSGKNINPLLYKTCFPIKPANLPLMEMTALYCRSVGTLIINDRITC